LNLSLFLYIFPFFHNSLHLNTFLIFKAFKSVIFFVPFSGSYYILNITFFILYINRACIKQHIFVGNKNFFCLYLLHQKNIPFTISKNHCVYEIVLRNLFLEVRNNFLHNSLHKKAFQNLCRNPLQLLKSYPFSFAAFEFTWWLNNFVFHIHI